MKQLLQIYIDMHFTTAEFKDEVESQVKKHSLRILIKHKL